MADFDLYDDLELLHAQEKQKSAEDLAWKEKYEVALGTIERLQGEKKELNKKIKQLEVNFASLFDTARTEIKRKDNLIAQLRKEKDDICFRRNVRPVKKDLFDGSDGGRFNPFANDTLEKRPKTVEKPVAEKSVASSSRVKDGERHKGNHREYPSNGGRGRDRSRDKSSDRFRGRRDERNYDRRHDRFDRDKSQTGSSDGYRDKTDKGSRAHPHRIDSQKEKYLNGTFNGYDSSKQDNYSKDKPESNKELKIKSQKETKTENGKAFENLLQLPNPIANKENTKKTETLEADILKDVKEFKKQKLIEAEEAKPVDDPVKVATEKSNQFLDALFDDLGMNDEESSNGVCYDLEKSPPAHVQSVPDKKTDEKIATKTDENFNVELLGTPLKQTVSTLFDDLFGPSPVVSVNIDRRNSLLSVGESSSNDSLQFRPKLAENSTDFISNSTKSTPFVGTDLNVNIFKEIKETEEKSTQNLNEVTSKVVPLVVDLIVNSTKEGDKIEEKTVQQLDEAIPKVEPSVADLNMNRTKEDDDVVSSKKLTSVTDFNMNSCQESAKTIEKSTQQANELPTNIVLPAKTAKTFKFVEFDSSFYSSEDEEVAEKDTAIQSQSDIESPPFENCVERDVNSSNLAESEKDKEMGQADIDSRSDTCVPAENSNDKRFMLSEETHRIDNSSLNLTHAEKQKGSNKSDKKDDKQKRDSHHSLKDYKSSSTSSSSRSKFSSDNRSHKSDSSRRHHQSSKSKHDHRSREKEETGKNSLSHRSAQSSGRHSADKRHHSTHNRKDSRDGKERIRNDSVGENKGRTTPRLTLSKSNEDSTAKPAALQDDNSSDLRLYQDQVISLTCDEISDEEGEEVIERKAGHQKRNFVGLYELSDEKPGEVAKGGSPTSKDVHQAESDRKKVDVALTGIILSQQNECNEKEGEVNESLTNNMQEANEENHGDNGDAEKSENESKRSVEGEAEDEMSLQPNEVLETTESVYVEKVAAETTNCNVEPSSGDKNISPVNFAVSSDVEEPFKPRNDEMALKGGTNIDLKPFGADTDQVQNSTIHDKIDLDEKNKLSADSDDKPHPNNIITDENNECHVLVDVQEESRKLDKQVVSQKKENSLQSLELTSVPEHPTQNDFEVYEKTAKTCTKSSENAKVDEEPDKSTDNVHEFVDVGDAHKLTNCKKPKRGEISFVEFFKSVNEELAESNGKEELPLTDVVASDEKLGKPSSFAPAEQTSELQNISDNAGDSGIDSTDVPVLPISPLKQSNPLNSAVLAAVMPFEETASESSSLFKTAVAQPADDKEETVSSGRRKKLKTPRKCTGEGKDPLTIIKMISGRYAKSDDGRSSNKQRKSPSPKLRRTQSTSNLTSNDGEGEIDPQIPINGKEETSNMKLLHPKESCSTGEDEYHLEMPVLRVEEDSRDTVSIINQKEESKSEVLACDTEIRLEKEQFITTEEAVPTNVSKKRKREKVSHISDDDCDESKLSIKMHHKKRILQNSDSGKSITKVPVDNCLNNKQSKKTPHSFAESIVTCATDTNDQNKKTDKESDSIAPHLDELVVPSNASAVSDSVDQSERRKNCNTFVDNVESGNHTAEVSSVSTPLVKSENKKTRNQIVEQSSGIDVESIEMNHSPYEVSLMADSLRTNDSSNIDDKPSVITVDSTALCDQSLGNFPNKTLITTNKIKKKHNKIADNVNTIVMSNNCLDGSLVKDSVVPVPIASGNNHIVGKVKPVATSCRNLQTASVDRCQRSSNDSNKPTELSHPVECTDTSNNKRKYKKRILQNFIDSDSTNVASSHTQHKIKRPQNSSNSNDAVEPDNDRIHHKKRLLQQSSDNAGIKDSTANCNKKKHAKKDEATTNRNKKKQEDYSPPTTTRDDIKIQHMELLQESLNTSTAHDFSKSEAAEANRQDDFTCETVSTTSQDNRKYKKRILESFTDSNAAVVLSNELIIKSSVAADRIAVDSKKKPKKNCSEHSLDPSDKHPAAIDSAPTHKKKRNKKCTNFEENPFAVESKEPEYRDPEEFDTKMSLVVSVMKLSSPVKVSPVNKLKVTVGSTDPCLYDGSVESKNDTNRPQEATNSENPQPDAMTSSISTQNVSYPTESHSNDERERNAIYIKRKMKPSKQVSEKKNKQKLVPCDKPSSLEKPISPTAKRKRSLSHDSSLPNTSAATPTHHKIFNEDVFSENPHAALPSPYNANGDDVQYQEIDNRMRSMFQSPPQLQQHTNVACSFELANTFATDFQDDNLEGNLTIEETLTKSENSLCDTSTSSRKISVGSNDYVIETIGTHTANVFITRKKCKKRMKIGLATS